MMSRRLTVADLAQLAAGAALMSPAAAHFNPQLTSCVGQPDGTRTCDKDAESIWWSGDNYTYIVDGWECQEGSHEFEWYRAEDGGADDKDQIEEDLLDECEEWAGGSGGFPD